MDFNVISLDICDFNSFELICISTPCSIWELSIRGLLLDTIKSFVTAFGDIGGEREGEKDRERGKTGLRMLNGFS